MKGKHGRRRKLTREIAVDVGTRMEQLRGHGDISRVGGKKKMDKLDNHFLG